MGIAHVVSGKCFHQKCSVNCASKELQKNFALDFNEGLLLKHKPVDFNKAF